MSELDYAREYEGAVTAETRTVQRWDCPDCMEGILWQPPMTKAERIYHHYRVGHREGGSLVAPQPAPDTGGEWRVAHDGLSRPMIETSDGRLLSLSQFEGGRWISYRQEESDCAQIASDHARAALVPGLVEALRSAFSVIELVSLGHVAKNGPEVTQASAQVDAALALMKGRE